MGLEVSRQPRFIGGPQLAVERADKQRIEFLIHHLTFLILRVYASSDEARSQQKRALGTYFVPVAVLVALRCQYKRSKEPVDLIACQGCKSRSSQSLLGSQLQPTSSIVQSSSPHIAAEASLVCEVPSTSASFADVGCTARRFFDAGAHTTRHSIVQSSGIEHAFLIVNDIASSPFDAWSTARKSPTDFLCSSATAGAERSENSARAKLTHRARSSARM